MSYCNDTALGACVMPTCMFGLEMVALTDQQQKLQVCENKWVRRIIGAARVERRRMNDLREEIGMQVT